MPRSFQCLAFLALATFTTSVGAENIINEHIAAVGGDKLAEIKTLQRAGTVSLTGPFGAFQGSLSEDYDIAGKKGHRLMDLAIFRIESAWTDTEGWQDGPPEGLRDMREEELNMAKMNGTASMVASIKNQYGLEAFQEPEDAEFNEQACAHVKVKNSPVELYINQETKLLAGLAVGDQLKIMFDDYKEHEGIQFPGKVTTKLGQPDVTIVNEYEETEINGEIDESVFAKPELEPAGDSEESP